LEAIGAWRKQAFSGHLNAEDSRAAIDALGSLDIQRVPHEPLLERIWELRENVTPADAAYVALAEELGAPLLTTDARLTRAVGPRCQFELIE
jgi:predicted nucleic acid-binding protein